MVCEHLYLRNELNDRKVVLFVKAKRVLSFICVLSLIGTMFTGCGGKDNPEPEIPDVEAGGDMWVETEVADMSVETEVVESETEKVKETFNIIIKEFSDETDIVEVTDESGVAVTDESGVAQTEIVKYKYCDPAEFLDTTYGIVELCSDCFVKFSTGNQELVRESLEVRKKIEYLSKLYKEQWSEGSVLADTGEELLATYYVEACDYFDTFLMFMDVLSLYSPIEGEQFDKLLTARKLINAMLMLQTKSLEDVEARIREANIVADFNFELEVLSKAQIEGGGGWEVEITEDDIQAAEDMNNNTVDGGLIEIPTEDGAEVTDLEEKSEEVESAE